MKEYVVKIMGCDDSTTITIGLTPKQVELMKRIEELIDNEAKTICQPTIEITERD